MNARLITPLLVAAVSSLRLAAQAAPAPAAPAGGTATTPSTAAGAVAPVAAAPAATPGKAHICLAPASVETASGTATDAMTAVRETFTSYLTGPTLEVAPLTARLPDQARQEAKASNCPFVLFTSVKQVHSSGGGGSSLLSRVAGSAIQQGAYAAGGVTSNTAGQIGINAAGGAAGAAATNYGSLTKPNDELTLTARLESGDGKVLVNSTNKKKAESSGEDLLTPLVEKAATAVAGAVAKGGK
jgi:hypothetical protein